MEPTCWSCSCAEREWFQLCVLAFIVLSLVFRTYQAAVPACSVQGVDIYVWGDLFIAIFSTFEVLVRTPRAINGNEISWYASDLMVGLPLQWGALSSQVCRMLSLSFGVRVLRALRLFPLPPFVWLAIHLVSQAMSLALFVLMAVAFPLWMFSAIFTDRWTERRDVGRRRRGD
eukprot:UN0848